MAVVRVCAVSGSPEALRCTDACRPDAASEEDNDVSMFVSLALPVTAVPRDDDDAAVGDKDNASEGTSPVHWARVTRFGCGETKSCFGV